MQKIPVIIGLGKTGLSCAQHLAKQKKAFVIMDTRTHPPCLDLFQQQFPEIPIMTGILDSVQCANASEIIVSPGISLSEPAIANALKKNVPVISEIELFAREAKAPVIGITGTNAKGTVTTLLSEMIKNAGFSCRTGGNIGTPALYLLDTEEPDFYVLEISSFQLETTFSLRTIAATILNISPDHLDRHHDIASYKAAKQHIYQHCDTAVFNRNDILTFPEYPTKRQITFGLDTPSENAFGLQDNFLAYGNEKLFDARTLRIQGKHNWANALAALALGQAINLPIAVMLETLKTFRGLSHRCEWVAVSKNNVNWYNDSKGTNVGATLAALEGFGSTLAGKIILIAGGLGKNADFSALQTAVRQFVRTAILIGHDAPEISKAIATETTVLFADSLSDAIKLSLKKAQPGDIVLLSPAAASFDMFKDYEDRGRQFSTLVKDYLAHDI